MAVPATLTAVKNAGEVRRSRPIPYLDTIVTVHGIESVENRLVSAFLFFVHTEFIIEGIAKKAPIWYNRGVKTTTKQGDFPPS